MAEDDSVSLALELTGSDLDLRTVGAVAHKLETLLSQLEAGITGDKPHAMWRVEVKTRAPRCGVRQQRESPDARAGVADVSRCP